MGLKTTGGSLVFWFGPQNPIGVPVGIGGGTWHHRETCVEVKQIKFVKSLAIGCFDLKLDHFAHGVKWLSKNI